MTITITSSGIALDGPLVAGEKVAVAVSGLSLAAEDRPTLALLARFPDALLASVELAESETAGTWTGELDTATKQTAFFFATARADERRDVVLELVAGRASLARLIIPMANSALCPKPDDSPFASPVYVPVPGAQGADGKMAFRVNRNPTVIVEDGIARVNIADGEFVILSSMPSGAYAINFYPGEDGVFAAYFENGATTESALVAIDGVTRVLQPYGKVSFGYAANADRGGALLWCSVIDEGEG